MNILELDVDADSLYFNNPLPDGVADLLERAANAYAQGGAKAEDYLLRAFVQAPKHLTVLVALYRFYYYRQRLDDASKTAALAMSACAEQLALATPWQQLGVADIDRCLAQSVGLTRFYLLALKGAGYLALRQGLAGPAYAMLSKVVELDPRDQLGAKGLARLAAEYGGNHRQTFDIQTAGAAA